MTDKNSAPDNNKDKSLPEDYTAPPKKEGNVATSLFLFFWYLTLWIGGIVLVGFVALFVACMV